MSFSPRILTVKFACIRTLQQEICIHYQFAISLIELIILRLFSKRNLESLHWHLRVIFLKYWNRLFQGEVYNTKVKSEKKVESEKWELVYSHVKIAFVKTVVKFRSAVFILKLAQGYLYFGFHKNLFEIKFKHFLRAYSIRAYIFNYVMTCWLQHQHDKTDWGDIISPHVAWQSSSKMLIWRGGRGWQLKFTRSRPKAGHNAKTVPH